MMVAAGIAPAAGLIALVAWLARPTPAHAPAADAPASTSAVPNGRLADLRALLPPGYPTGSCTPPTDPPPAAAAALTCGPNLDPGGPATATYTLARNPQALQTQFQNVISAATMVVCPGLLTWSLCAVGSSVL